ncbi:MAG TPA: molybdopterin converting factor subunit 1 [Xanthobacteraceae bacterium]|jgi:molybdopterin synthase sulfur carrier subunit
MKVLYFAWIRERVGKAEEDVSPPASVATVGELVQWLAGRGEEYAYAFDNPKIVRAAIDRVHVQPQAAIKGAREIALFPPMTGG